MLTERALVPHMTSLGFVEGVHYLACEATEAAALATLQYWLRNSDPTVDARLRGIAAAGQALVRRQYRTKLLNWGLRTSVAGITAAPLARWSHVASGFSGEETARLPVLPRPFVGRLGWRTALERHAGPDSDVVDGVEAIRKADTVILRSAGASGGRWAVRYRARWVGTCVHTTSGLSCRPGLCSLLSTHPPSCSPCAPAAPACRTWHQTVPC